MKVFLCLLVVVVVGGGWGLINAFFFDATGDQPIEPEDWVINNGNKHTVSFNPITLLVAGSLSWVIGAWIASLF